MSVVANTQHNVGMEQAKSYMICEQISQNLARTPKPLKPFRHHGYLFK